MNEDTTQLGVSSADDSLAAALGADASLGEQPLREEAEPSVGAEQLPQGDGESTEQEASVEYLDQLAETLDITPEQLMGLKVKLKVDGQETDSTLGDVIKINQLEGHVNRKSIELSEKQKAWESEQTKVRTEWAQRVQFAENVLNQQEAQLAKEFQSVNWQQLQAQDPAQYASLYLQFQQAGQSLQQQKQQLTTHYQQTQQQVRETLRPKALEVIKSNHPDLADPISYGNALSEMKSYLKGIGAQENNFEVLELDPVVFTIARDAARYQQLMAKKADVVNKVKVAPKLEKPSPRAIGNDKAKALRDLAMGGNEDAMAAFLANS